MCSICSTTFICEIWFSAVSEGSRAIPLSTFRRDSSPYLSQDLRWGQQTVSMPATRACIAPQSEWPHTMMFETLSVERENSIAAGTLLSSSVGVGGGTRLPIFRMTKRSPGFVDANRFGTTRLSEQAIKRASGFWPRASLAKSSRRSSVSPFLNSPYIYSVACCPGIWSQVLCSLAVHPL